MMVDNKLKRTLLISAFAATAFSIPLSVWFLSFFTVILIILWSRDGGINRIYFLASQKKTVLIFLGIWLVYLIWFINTSDIEYGLKELKQKLPLIVFPLVAGFSSPLLDKKEVKIIISFFIAGVVISSITGMITEYNLVLSGRSDSRELSPFISHIRLALMSVFAVTCSGWYFFVSEKTSRWDVLYIPAALWLVIYDFFLLSLTGLCILLLILITTAFFVAFKKRSISLSVSFVLLLILSVTSAGLYFRHEIRSYYMSGGSYGYPLKQFTAEGNAYRHDTLKNDIENGNKVWIYLSEKELKEQWNIRSTIPFDSLDRKGQMIRYTLIRYMTSSGLKKDSAGVSSLSQKDINNIEGGMTNSLFAHWSRLKSKVYETIWQIDYYRNGGNPSGHSLTQRIEFFKTGWHLFLRMPVFGTGTGDVVNEMKAQYDIDHSMLDQNHRLLTHNQFLHFLISFGITGFIMICFSLFFPIIKIGILKHYLPLSFLIIVFLSMLWEDTLETHTGISFFAYFYSLFVFGSSEYET